MTITKDKIKEITDRHIVGISRRGLMRRVEREIAYFHNLFNDQNSGEYTKEQSIDIKVWIFRARIDYNTKEEICLFDPNAMCRLSCDNIFSVFPISMKYENEKFNHDIYISLHEEIPPSARKAHCAFRADKEIDINYIFIIIKDVEDRQNYVEIYNEIVTFFEIFSKELDIRMEHK